MARLVQNATFDERQTALSLTALDDALRAADPAVLVVPPRIVRRVIKQHAGVSGIGLRVPHRKTYIIHRDALLSIVDLADLDLDPDTELPEEVILIARPTGDMLSEMSSAEALIKYWRQLFHARVHLALEERIAAGGLGDGEVRSGSSRSARLNSKRSAPCSGRKNICCRRART